MRPELEFYNKADRYFTVEKDYKTALLFYKKAIEINPFNADYFELVGNCYTFLANSFGVIPYYKWALLVDSNRLHLKPRIAEWDSGPNAPRTLHSELLSYNLRDLRDNLKVPNPAIFGKSTYNNITSSYSFITSYYFELDCYAECIKYHQEWETWRKKINFAALCKRVGLDCEVLESYNIERAIAYSRLKDFSQAEFYFNSVLQHVVTSDNKLKYPVALPGFKETFSIQNRIYLGFYERGLLRQTLGKSEEAADDFKKAIEFGKGYLPEESDLRCHPGPHLRLREEQAKIQNKAKEAQNILIQAKNCFAKAEYKECIRICEKAQTISSDHDEIHLYIALSHFKLGNFASTLDNINKISASLAFFPSHIKNKIDTIRNLTKRISQQNEKRNIAHTEYQNWLITVNNTLAENVITLAVTGNLRYKHLMDPICIGGKLKTATEQKIQQVLKECLRGYRIPQNFSPEDHEVLILEVAKALQQFMIKPKSKSGKNSPRIDFSVQNKAIVSDYSFRRAINLAIDKARKAIDCTITKRSNIPTTLLDYDKKLKELELDYKRGLEDLAAAVFASLGVHVPTIQQPSTTLKSEKNSDCIDQAETFLSMKKYVEAITEFEKAINLNLKTYPVYRGLATAYMSVSNYKSAITYYLLAIELKPDVANYLSLAQAYRMSANWDGVISAYQKILILNPSYEHAFYHIGEAHSALARYSEALTFFHKAIERNPNSAESYLGRAIALRKTGDIAAAIRNCELAIRHKPNGYPRAIQLLQELKTNSAPEKSPPISPPQKELSSSPSQNANEENQQKIEAIRKDIINPDKQDILKQKLEKLKQTQDLDSEDLSNLDDLYQELESLATELRNADYYVARADFYVYAAQKVNDQDQSTELYNKALINYGLAIKIKPLYKGIAERKQKCLDLLIKLNQAPQKTFTHTNMTLFTQKNLPTSRADLSPDMQKELDRIKEEIRKQKLETRNQAPQI